MPDEELTFRQSLDLRMQTFEHDMRASIARIELQMQNGFNGVHTRQDLTNGRVRFAEKMIYLATGGLGILAIIVIPLLFTLISTGKL